MAKSRWSALLMACALLAPTLAHAAPEWWRIGQKTKGDWVFIDAASIDDSGWGEIAYSGMYLYATPFTMDNGTVLQYEVFTAILDCDLYTVTTVSRSFYRADRTLVTSIADNGVDPVKPDQAAGWHYAFICENERTGGAHGFQPVGGAPY